MNKLKNVKVLQLFLVFSINVVITFIVSFLPVNPSVVVDTVGKVDTMRSIVSIEGFGVPYIFGNNLMLTLPSFIPFVGLGWSLILSYNNGVAFSVLNIPYLMFLMPFFILEYLASSIAVVEGLWVVRAIKDKRSIVEISNRVLKNVGFCSLILFFSAVIEMII